MQREVFDLLHFAKFATFQHEINMKIARRRPKPFFPDPMKDNADLNLSHADFFCADSWRSMYNVHGISNYVSCNCDNDRVDMRLILISRQLKGLNLAKKTSTQSVSN